MALHCRLPVFYDQPVEVFCWANLSLASALNELGCDIAGAG